MDETGPRRDSRGNLLCPRCGSPLVDKNASFYLHGQYVGKFGSKFCDICSFSMLTSNGYEDALKASRQMALVGPAEEIIMQTIKSTETLKPIDIVFEYVSQVASFNLNQNIEHALEKIEMETVSKKSDFLKPRHTTKEYVSKSMEILAR
jgi:hypothetical protein